MLKSWKMNQVKMGRKRLAYLLQNKYSDTDLSYSKLIQRDSIVVAQLLDVVRPAGFCLFLGNVEKASRGDCDTTCEIDSDGRHSMSKLHYETYEITHVTGLGGVEVLSRSAITLIASHIIGAKNMFSSSTCDDEIVDASFLQQTYRRSVSIDAKIKSSIWLMNYRSHSYYPQSNASPCSLKPLLQSWIYFSIGIKL